MCMPPTTQASSLQKPSKCFNIRSKFTSIVAKFARESWKFQCGQVWFSRNLGGGVCVRTMLLWEYDVSFALGCPCFPLYLAMQSYQSCTCISEHEDLLLACRRLLWRGPQKASLYCWGSYSAKGMKNFQYLSGPVSVSVLVFISLSSHPFVSISPAYTFSPCCSFCFRWARKSRKEAWGSCGRHLYLHLSPFLLHLSPFVYHVVDGGCPFVAPTVFNWTTPLLFVGWEGDLSSFAISLLTITLLLVCWIRVSGSSTEGGFDTKQKPLLQMELLWIVPSLCWRLRFRSWLQFYLEPSKVLAVKTLKPSNLTIPSCA